MILTTEGNEYIPGTDHSWELTQKGVKVRTHSAPLLVSESPQMSGIAQLKEDIAALRAKINRLKNESNNNKGKVAFVAHYDRQRGTVSGGPVEDSDAETIPIVYDQKNGTIRRV